MRILLDDTRAGHKYLSPIEKQEPSKHWIRNYCRRHWARDRAVKNHVTWTGVGSGRVIDASWRTSTVASSGY